MLQRESVLARNRASLLQMAFFCDIRLSTAQQQKDHLDDEQDHDGPQDALHPESRGRVFMPERGRLFHQRFNSTFKDCGLWSPLPRYLRDPLLRRSLGRRLRNHPADRRNPDQPCCCHAPDSHSMPHGGDLYMLLTLL